MQLLTSDRLCLGTILRALAAGALFNGWQLGNAEPDWTKTTAFYPTALAYEEINGSLSATFSQSSTDQYRRLVYSANKVEGMKEPPRLGSKETCQTGCPLS